MNKKTIACAAALCLSVQPAGAYAGTSDRLSEIEAQLTVVADKIDECKRLGLDVSYERVNYITMCDFVNYGRQDIDWGEEARAEYVANSLGELYSDTVSALDSYINGTAVPKTVVRNSNYAGIENGNFVDSDGSPVFYNGYGAFNRVRNETDKLYEYGSDIIQIEIGPGNVLTQKGATDGWAVSVPDGYNAQVSISSSGLNGTNGLKIVNSEASEQYCTIRQHISVKPNTVYVLSAWVRATEAQGLFISPQGWSTPAASRITPDSGTYSWKQYTAEYTTGEDETEAELLIVSNGAAKQWLIDDISLAEKGSSESIVQNSGFEITDMAESEHFAACVSRIRDIVTRTLDNAYRNGLCVNVLISPHYFPSWILEKYPELTDIDCGLGYDINNPIAREAIDLYIKTLMSEIADHPALHSICLTNEPTCDTRTAGDLSAQYSEYLAGVYADISELNAVYGTSYTGFEQVGMPQTDTMDARYYDWVEFNNGYTGAWHEYLAETVHKYAPEVKVHSKIMSLFGKTDSLNWGIDIEQFAGMSDILGNDAYGFFSDSGTSKTSGLMSKLTWYELLSSIAPDKPVFNSEDHIIVDGDSNYSKEHTTHISADIWQGAVHGRDASVLWVWERTNDASSSRAGSILHRPDAVAAVGRRSLDLNRLRSEIAALEAAPAKATVLYSPTSRAYSKEYIYVMRRAFEAAVYAGAAPRFITEKQLAAGESPEGLLIIPAARNITAPARERIKEYKENGGRVLVIGAASMSADEHNIAYDDSFAADAALDVRVSGTSVESPSLGELQSYIADMAGIGNVITTAGGEPVSYVDTVTADCNGERLYNLCNYTWEDITVNVPCAYADLITGEQTGSEITLKPFTPVLIAARIPEMNAQLEDVYTCADTAYVTVRLSGDLQADLYADFSLLLCYDDGRAVNAGGAAKTVKSGTQVCITFSFKLDGNPEEIRLCGAYENGELSARYTF